MIPLCCRSTNRKAQALFFPCNEAGDPRPLFFGHFDTRTGAKVDCVSYARIARALCAPAAEILFLSDDRRELAAARAAGLQVAQVVKETTQLDAEFRGVADFAELELTPLDPVASVAASRA
jgi:enolase-phosphatase E1